MSCETQYGPASYEAVSSAGAGTAGVDGTAAAAAADSGGMDFEGTVAQAFEVAGTSQELCTLLVTVTGKPGGECGKYRWQLLDRDSVSKEAIIALAKAKRDTSPEMWTTDVAREFGAFLRGGVS